MKFLAEEKMAVDGGAGPAPPGAVRDLESLEGEEVGEETEAPDFLKYVLSLRIKAACCTASISP